MAKQACDLIWDYFTKLQDRGNGKAAKCNQCSKVLSYKTTVTNLKQHLVLKHKDDYNSFLRELKSLLPDSQFTGDDQVQLAEQEGVEPSTSTEYETKNQIRGSYKTASSSRTSLFIWNYFSKVDGLQGEEKRAKCKHCYKELSYRTSITNLKKHLEVKHIDEYNTLLSELGPGTAKAKIKQDMQMVEDTIYLDYSELENASVGSFESYSELVLEPCPPKKIRKINKDPLDESQTEMDETDIMTRMWSRKLKKMPEETRDTLIFKINNLIYGETMRNSCAKFEESGLTDL